MKFTEIIIENFGAIGDANVTLSDRGLVLVQGENLDSTSANSNGAGKSTVVEAIAWALYGKTAKKLTGDAVINTAAGKGCRVGITVDDDEVVYKIARHRKHKTGKNRLEVSRIDTDGTTADLTLGTDALTQGVVEKVIGCSHDVFVSAVYSGQEAMPDIPGSTDRHLKLLIEEAAGVTLLEEAHKIAKRRLADHQSAMTSQETVVDRLATKIDNMKIRVDDAKSNVDRWKRERDARLIDMESDLRTLVDDIKKLQKRLDAMPSETALDQEEARIKNAVKTADDQEREREDLSSKLTKCQNALATLKERASKAVQDYKNAKARLDETFDPGYTVCSSCGRSHDDETLEKSRETLRTDIADFHASANEAISKARTASQSVTDARSALESFERDMIDTTNARALSASLNASRAQRADLGDQIDRTRSRARSKSDAIKKEKAAANPYDAEVKARKVDLDKLKADHKTESATLQGIKGDLTVARDTASVFSPAGVRAHILDTVTPYLNERTAHYLGSLTDGEIDAVWQTISFTAKGEAREKFSVNVSKSDGTQGFPALSGGEKRKVRVSCALALQDLVATRAAKPIDLFIADEIDAALDDAGLERLMNILEDKARERGTVLIVSHSDLADWVRDSMTVTKQNGVAVVKENA